MASRPLSPGDTIALDGSAPALKPCRYCRHGWGAVQFPRPPHGHGIICKGCKRHIGWLPKSYGEPDPDDDFDVIED